MPGATTPLQSSLGGGIGGVQLTQPVAPSVFAAIEAALNRHAVLALRNQVVTDEQQLAFGWLSGARETSPTYTGDERRGLFR
jgi:alpha-ketoglutarate-dependent taurine dioxygenase